MVGSLDGSLCTVIVLFFVGFVQLPIGALENFYLTFTARFLHFFPLQTPMKAGSENGETVKRRKTLVTADGFPLKEGVESSRYFSNSGSFWLQSILFILVRVVSLCSAYDCRTFPVR